MNDSTPVTTAPPAKPQKRPGTLVTGVKITLHMTHSMLLYNGREDTKKSAGILGLDGFARICSMVNGTPEAKALIEERLRYAEERLANLQRQNDEARKRSRLSVERHSSKEPMEIEIETTTSLAGRGAQLLQTYDDVTRDVVLLHRLGIFDSDDAAERTRLCAKYVRSAYASGFEALGKVRKIDKPAASTASAPVVVEEASQ